MFQARGLKGQTGRMAPTPKEKWTFPSIHGGRPASLLGRGARTRKRQHGGASLSSASSRLSKSSEGRLTDFGVGATCAMGLEKERGFRFGSGNASEEHARKKKLWRQFAEAGVSSSSSEDWSEEVEEDELPDPNKVFPRLKEKDPYKLLGIGAEASYDEVQEARNFLVEEFKGHKMSVEAIDIAHDKIISQNFKERRQDGIKINSKNGKRAPPPPVEEEPDGPLSKFIDTRVAKKALLKTVGVFLSVVVWTVATALDSEPTAQITTGLIACTFFVQQKRQEKADKEENVFWGSVGTAIVATAAGWILGNITNVVLPVFPEGVSVQAVCTIFALIAQWFASTYAK